MSETDKVLAFILAVADAAIRDIQSGIPKRHRTNTGSELVTRLQLGKHRSYPRRGDEDEARRIYTATRFLYDTEVEDYSGKRK